ncbi:hypothetical protein [Kordiimonas sp.]
MATGRKNNATPSGDLLLFTSSKQRWMIIGCLSVLTLDWTDFRGRSIRGS